MNTNSPLVQKKDGINRSVLYGSLVGMLVFLFYTVVYTEQAGDLFSASLAWVNQTFGWYYMLAAVIYLVFVLYVGFSRFGKIRLGADDSRPEFSLVSWASMLFAAGIGIDVLFFSVAEPLSHYLTPPELAAGSQEALRFALPQTFFHWGLTGWAMYVLMGLALAYFSYRHKLPLAIRSTLYPLIGKRIYGPIGNVVDTAAVIGTVFGIATSLGIGVMQLNYGLSTMFGIAESLSNQIVLIVVVVLFAALSAISGVDKGIRRLSEFNMLLATALLLFVLFQGNTLGLLDALVLNVGDYVSGFVAMSFNTYAFAGDEAQQWKGWWTIFFWAWWIAWTPFIGMFLARISRGRTIREFVIGALLIPLGFMVAWMSIFGNTGIDLVANQGISVLGEQALNNPQSTIYTVLEQFPFVSITTTAVLILAVLFFVTSADSGALVLANFTSILSDVDQDAPAYLRGVWAAVIGAVTIALLLVGGLNALQSVVVMAALPFSIVLFATIAGLYKALAQEVDELKTVHGVAIKPANGDWRGRLHQALTTTHPASASTLMELTVRPALNTFADEVQRRGHTVSVEEHCSANEPVTRLSLKVDLEGVRDFVYDVRLQTHQSATELYAYLTGGERGTRVSGYSCEDMLNDLVFEFTRHFDVLTLGQTGEREALLSNAMPSPSSLA
jgi:choline/glycine/proline betaine transport protein